eukprot:m.437017 g.437017  ORF g.437017 m.437017 type:complete len:514 (+) comp18050_c0_seq1:58-1599(+)
MPPPGRAQVRDQPSEKRTKVILSPEEARNQPFKQWDGLDLSGVGLRMVNTEICSLKCLTSLYLNQNQLSAIPPEIANLNHLEMLDLSHNKIQMVPREMGSMRSLRELLLFANQITSLPFEIGMLFQLHTLGLHGNPLDEPVNTYSMEGTESVMTYLLDNAQIQEEPPKRHMQRPVRTAFREGDVPPASFTVLAYNVLCSKYATRQLYAYCPSWALEWDYRKKMILDEIKRKDADIVLLQEVETCEFYAYFQPELHQRGFEGIFSAKSRARTMHERDRKSVDGCAIFFRCDIFEKQKEMLVEFERLSAQLGRGSADILNRVMSKDNIAIGAILQHKPTKSPIFVGNAHLHWDPQFKDVKVVQAAMLVHEIAKFVDVPDQKRMPILLGGDFNSEPDSGVFKLISEGRVAIDHPDLVNREYAKFAEEVGFDHDLKLRSCYNGELPYTNYTADFKGIIDYIFYSVDGLAPIEVLGPIPEEVMEQFDGCPNPHFPSDHLPIFAHLSITRPVQPAEAKA